MDRLLNQHTSASAITHRADKLAIVYLGRLVLKNVLIQPNKICDLVTTSPSRRLLEARQVKDVSHKRVVLTTEFVHQQILHSTHDAVDCPMLAAALVAQALGEML